MLQKKRGDDLCLQADSLFFGFNKENLPNRSAALRLYEESEQLGVSKASLAIGSIYEKGLVNPIEDRGGMQSLGAVEKNCAEPDTSKAFEYYDNAANEEPYALFKLGQFMEQGLYEEGYRGKPNKTFAFAFYKKAIQHEKGCREALQKFGEYYQFGHEVEKNVSIAQRKMEESAADGSLLGMNALGSMFYNEHKDHY